MSFVTAGVKGRRYRLGIISLYALMIVLALIFILPIIFMVISSFKPDQQLLSDSSSLRAFLPVGSLSLNNYFGMVDRVPVVRFVFNSLVVTVLTVGLGLIINSMAAYSLAILRWRGRNIILGVIIATFILPFEVIAVPLLLVVNNLPWIGPGGFTTGWLNTYHVQIFPFVAEAFSIFLFVQYFRDLPRELIEAARIDGAGWFKIYTSVIVPISGPVFATAAILRFLFMWNQYLWPLMVVQSEEIRPVMVGLGYFFQLDIAWGQIMAYLTIITVPVLIFFLLLQKAFIESIASTGIKG